MTKLKQSQEALKTISDKKEQILSKYRRFIFNLKWHIKTNNPKVDEVNECNDKINLYRDFINDLKLL